jgi:hypothetical protein
VIRLVFYTSSSPSSDCPGPLSKGEGIRPLGFIEISSSDDEDVPKEQGNGGMPGAASEPVGVVVEEVRALGAALEGDASNKAAIGEV